MAGSHNNHRATARSRYGSSTNGAPHWCGSGRRTDPRALRRPGSSIRGRGQVRHSPATLGAVIQQLERLGQPALLVTNYVTQPLAEALKKPEIVFLDAAGNAYLKHPPVLIWVKGQRPQTTNDGERDNTHVQSKRTTGDLSAPLSSGMG